MFQYLVDRYFPVAIAAAGIGLAGVSAEGFVGAKSSAPTAPVRKEFPETWLWQTIASERWTDKLFAFLSNTLPCPLVIYTVAFVECCLKFADTFIPFIIYADRFEMH